MPVPPNRITFTSSRLLVAGPTAIGVTHPAVNRGPGVGTVLTGSETFDPEGIVLGEKLVQPGLVDSADDGVVLLLVADALGEGERRGDDVEQAEGEEGPHPDIDREVDDGEGDGEAGDGERDDRLHEERGGALGRNLGGCTHGLEPGRAERTAPE